MSAINERVEATPLASLVLGVSLRDHSLCDASTLTSRYPSALAAPDDPDRQRGRKVTNKRRSRDRPRRRERWNNFYKRASVDFRPRPRLALRSAGRVAFTAAVKPRDFSVSQSGKSRKQ